MNSLQSTNTVLMVRPCNFGFNSLTAIDNTYQNEHKNGQNKRIYILRPTER